MASKFELIKSFMMLLMCFSSSFAPENKIEETTGSLKDKCLAQMTEIYQKIDIMNKKTSLKETTVYSIKYLIYYINKNNNDACDECSSGCLQSLLQSTAETKPNLKTLFGKDEFTNGNDKNYNFVLAYYNLLGNHILPGKIEYPSEFCKSTLPKKNDCMFALEALGFHEKLNIEEILAHALYDIYEKIQRFEKNLENLDLDMNNCYEGSSQPSYLTHIANNLDISAEMPNPVDFCDTRLEEP